jgi:hypothetical protein
MTDVLAVLDDTIALRNAGSSRSSRNDRCPKSAAGIPTSLKVDELPVVPGVPVVKAGIENGTTQTNGIIGTETDEEESVPGRVSSQNTGTTGTTGTGQDFRGVERSVILLQTGTTGTISSTCGARLALARRST